MGVYSGDGKRKVSEGRGWFVSGEEIGIDEGKEERAPI